MDSKGHARGGRQERTSHLVSTSHAAADTVPHSLSHGLDKVATVDILAQLCDNMLSFEHSGGGRWWRLSNFPSICSHLRAIHYSTVLAM